jgi:hypothetical protein
MHPVAEAYKGFVLAEREQNLYNDSYFWLTVWNPDTAAPEEFQYAATAYGGVGPMSWESVQAAVAETPDGVKSAYAKWQVDRYRFGSALSLDYVMQQRMFKYAEVFKGATVRVARGRKVRKGLTGTVISQSSRTFGYNNVRHYFFIDCGADGSWTVDAENCDIIQHSPVKLQELFDLAN